MNSKFRRYAWIGLSRFSSCTGFNHHLLLILSVKLTCTSKLGSDWSSSEWQFLLFWILRNYASSLPAKIFVTVQIWRSSVSLSLVFWWSLTFWLTNMTRNGTLPKTSSTPSQIKPFKSSNPYQPMWKRSVFSPATIPSDSAKTTLENFKKNSNGKFDYRFVDPDNDPVTTKKYEITTDGSLVLSMDGRQQTLKVVSEDEIASALVKLTNPTSSVVYFLTGHGEHDPLSTGEDAYSTVATTLEKKNYSIKALNLLSTAYYPGRCRCNSHCWSSKTGFSI